MVTCKAGEANFVAVLSDGKHELCCDVPPEKGGKGTGFRPMDLIEAALAACVNVTVRAYADARSIRLTDVIVRVSLNKDDPNQVFIKEEVELVGDLSEKERTTLLQVAKQCPVAKTLAKPFSFNLEAVGSQSTKA